MSTIPALDRAHHHAADFLDGLSQRSVAATASVGELRRRLHHDLPANPTDATAVVDELVEAPRGGHLGSAGGRFFAWVIGGALPSALAADWLASTWDNNAALYACGPAAAVVEEVAGAWVKQLLGLPTEASFAFTTGCQMAHVTCLAAARHRVLHDAGWDVETQGLFGAPPIRVLVTEQRHGSMLIPIAKAARAWVHIDGAFGLWARASRLHASKAAGNDAADSWATDAHKWLNTPKDNGIAIVRDIQAHRSAMSIDAAYLSSPGGVRDQIDWTPDWTRRARGFAVYAAIRELGRSGLEDLIDRCCRHASTLTHGFAALAGVEMVAAPTLNQGLVRFLRPAAGASDAEHDAWTDQIIASLNREGTAFFSGSSWQGRRVMRISVVNWRTSEADVVATLAAAGELLEVERSAAQA